MTDVNSCLIDFIQKNVLLMHKGRLQCSFMLLINLPPSHLQGCITNEDCGNGKYCHPDTKNSKCLPCKATDVVNYFLLDRLSTISFFLNCVISEFPCFWTNTNTYAHVLAAGVSLWLHCSVSTSVTRVCWASHDRQDMSRLKKSLSSTSSTSSSSLSSSVYSETKRISMMTVSSFSVLCKTAHSADSVGGSFGWMGSVPVRSNENRKINQQSAKQGFTVQGQQ